MGLFDRLFGEKSNVTIGDDMIWLSKQAKFAGLAKVVRDCFAARERPTAVILVAHFEDCLAELQSIEDADSFAGPVTVTLAGDLRRVTSAEAVLDASQVIEIVAGERHLLSSRNNSVIVFARSLPCGCRITHHVSLEDPFMTMFGGETVKALLTRMGMKDDEAIQSRLISRRIKAAQKKIEVQATGDLPAQSAEEWMDRNVPG